jgi:hypothetical protein
LIHTFLLPTSQLLFNGARYAFADVEDSQVTGLGGHEVALHRIVVLEQFATSFALKTPMMAI